MDTIKLLGISASPRKRGNSHFLLEVALKAAEEIVPGAVEIELYSTSGKLYKPCDSCDQCHEQLGYCRQTDDDFAELRDKWIEADAIIYSIPVYHMGVPGNFKNFLDRVGNSVVEGFYSKPWKVMGTIGEEDTVFTVDAVKILSKNIVHMALTLKAGGKQLHEMLTEDGGYDIFLRRINSR
jgi:multimeric flavodoxin WrbA